MNKDSITASIEVPLIELHHPEKNLARQRQQSNSMMYKKAAEIIANNLYKNLGKPQPIANLSHSHKMLKSTSR